VSKKKKVNYRSIIAISKNPIRITPPIEAIRAYTFLLSYELEKTPRAKAPSGLSVKIIIIKVGAARKIELNKFVMCER